MGEIGAISNRGAASNEELRATAASLLQQAAQLSGLVAGFTISQAPRALHAPVIAPPGGRSPRLAHG